MPKSEYRKDFKTLMIDPDLAYLDSAATVLRPNQISEASYKYASEEHANIHRGAYGLSYKATERYDKVRRDVASFIGAKREEEIIFTYGTTDGINFLSTVLGNAGVFQKGDNIVISIFEHHSNIVPWQRIKDQYGLELRYLYGFDEASLSVIDANTKVISLTLMSNATGLRTPFERVIKRGHKVGALVIGDGAQYVGHHKVKVDDLGFDFLAFSGHKMFAPTGVGVLYGKYSQLEKLQPYRYGGDMIEYVYEQEASYAPIPECFEAGTPNIEGVIGLGEAIKYMNGLKMDQLDQRLNELREYSLKRLNELDYIHIIDDIIKVKVPEVENLSKPGHVYGPVISFTMDDVHPHDVASILDSYHVAIRAGHHCAQPLMKYLGITGTNRISFQLYNNRSDIDQLIEGLKQVRRWMGYES